MGSTIVFLILGLILIFGDSSANLMTNYKPMLVGLFFLGSIQLTFIGIVGEYVFKGYKESQHRPMYFVRNEYLD